MKPFEKTPHLESNFLFCYGTRSMSSLVCLLAMLAMMAGVGEVHAQGTAFSYQGSLYTSGEPANGSYDFEFALYNDLQAGNQVGPIVTNLATAVTSGFFTSTLDFSSAPWTGQPLWLQVLVRTNGGASFTALNPRQPITSSPYAIQSINATTATTADSANSVSATNLSGTIPNSALPGSPVFSGALIANAFSGNGAGLTNLNPTNLNAGTAAINISGNAATATTAANVTGDIADSQLSTNVALLNGTNLFSGTNYFAGASVATNTNNIIYGAFTGNLNGNAATASTATQAATATTANNFTGSLSGDVQGTQGATAVVSVGGQSATSVASAVIAANAATSTNTADTIVLRDGSGNFAAGAISANSFAGDGSALTNLNPANLESGAAAISISGNAATATLATNVTGNIADSQLSTNVAFLDGTNLFSGTNNFAGVTVATNTNNVIYGAFTGNLTGNAATSSTATQAATATTANNFTGSLLGDVQGTQGATVVVSVGGQSATNVASAVIAANAATSTNAAGVIVLRDGSGSFAAGAITANSFAGDGSALTNLNPANLESGTAAISITGNAATATLATNVTGSIADSQLSTNVPFLNGTNLFSGTNHFDGVIVATNTNNVIYGAFTGNLSGKATSAGSASQAGNATNFSGALAGDVHGTQGATVVGKVGGQSATNVASAVIAANAATSTNTAGTIVLRDGSGNFAASAITANSFAGDGSALTNLNPADLESGTAAISITGNAATATLATNVTGNIADSQLSTNVPFLNGTNLFSGTNHFAGVTVATNTNNVIYGTFTGNLSGNAATASSSTQATTAMTANNFSGSLSGDVLGTQRATVVASVSGQSAANIANGASAANSATSLNTTSTIVKRDASGNFAAGTITATGFSGNGSALTNLNASQLSATSGGNIDIGTASVPGDNGIIRIGAQGTQTNAYMAGIYGVTAASGVAVYVTSGNQLGTLTSSGKFKENIQSMNDSSTALLSLHPVTFRYKPEIDPAGIPQFGLVAEEVEKVNPELVAHDAQGRPYTVRYEAVNAMLLNEFLKEHRRVETQAGEIHELTERLNRLEKMISHTAEKP